MIQKIEINIETFEGFKTDKFVIKSFLYAFVNTENGCILKIKNRFYINLNFKDNNPFKIKGLHDKIDPNNPEIEIDINSKKIDLTELKIDKIGNIELNEKSLEKLKSEIKTFFIKEIENV